MQPFLAIVPARAGSRGVVRKNMREMGGVPLIAHTVDALLKAPGARIVVSSDDPEVVGWATMQGLEVSHRPAQLASAESTIADVALDLIERIEWDGLVGVFQPTSPLRSTESIERALEQFDREPCDSLASVVHEPHLFWFDEDGSGPGDASPMFSERVNRQFAKQKIYRETGAIQLITAHALRAEHSMVAAHHSLFEIDAFEADDIDTPEDLERVRTRSLRGTIVFRLTANALVGSGHLHHCLQLAEYLDYFRLEFLLKDCDDFAREHLRARGWSYRDESDLAHDVENLKGPGANLVVNDVLDTRVEDILIERAAGFRIVCVEDLGPGAQHADWVVNALYPAPSVPDSRLATGPKFATLRSEFLGLPEKVIRESPERVLITFGGTDPGNLAQRVTDALSNSTDCQLTVICGPAAPRFEPPRGVEVRHNVKNMAEEMWRSDLIVTAAGRTVYEAAAAGSPVVAIAQSAREATHAHLSLDGGVVSLGLGVLVSESQIRETVNRLLADHRLRAELSERLRRSVDALGAQRIASRIESLMKGL